MSIVARAPDVDADERESELVALVAERALRHGPKSNAVKTMDRIVLEMGLKNADAKRIIEKGEALAERMRAERTAQKENETRKNGTATKVRETVSTSLQAVTITIGGTLVMFAFTMYNLLPLAGTVAVIAGLVCFFTGAPHALRTFIVGLVMLAVYLIVGAIFSKALEQGDKKRT